MLPRHVYRNHRQFLRQGLIKMSRFVGQTSNMKPDFMPQILIYLEYRMNFQAQTEIMLVAETQLFQGTLEEQTARFHGAKRRLKPKN